MFTPPVQPFAALAIPNVASTSASLTHMDYQTEVRRAADVLVQGRFLAFPIDMLCGLLARYLPASSTESTAPVPERPAGGKGRVPEPRCAHRDGRHTRRDHRQPRHPYTPAGGRHAAPEGTELRGVSLLRHDGRGLPSKRGRKPQPRRPHHRRLLTRSVALPGHVE